MEYVKASSVWSAVIVLSGLIVCLTKGCDRTLVPLLIIAVVLVASAGIPSLEADRHKKKTSLGLNSFPVIEQVFIDEDCHHKEFSELGTAFGINSLYSESDYLAESQLDVSYSSYASTDPMLTNQRGSGSMRSYRELDSSAVGYPCYFREEEALRPVSQADLRPISRHYQYNSPAVARRDRIVRFTAEQNALILRTVPRYNINGRIGWKAVAQELRRVDSTMSCFSDERIKDKYINLLKQPRTSRRQAYLPQDF